MSDRPPFVVRSADVPEVEGAYPAPHDGEKLSFGRDLGRAAGTTSLGAWRERIPPGRRTSFTHAHQVEEEHVYVLSGTPSVRWIAAGEVTAHEHVLAPGDFVVFPAGTGIAHTIVNRSDRDAEVLVVGERRADERVVYPEDTAYAAWYADHRAPGVWRGANGPEADARPPATRIDTDRLVLRMWTPADARVLQAIVVANRAHLLPWMPFAEVPPTVDELVERIDGWCRTAAAGGDIVYGIFTREGRPIGSMGLHDRVGQRARELGYWVSHKAEGHGYVTEACAALVRLGFEVLGYERMEIHCDPRNSRSAAVAVRLGFALEATLPRRIPLPGGQLGDAAIYAAYKVDHPASAPATRPYRAHDLAGRRLV